jgi:hypothetical protein
MPPKYPYLFYHFKVILSIFKTGQDVPGFINLLGEKSGV